jgi:hypothetical protein
MLLFRSLIILSALLIIPFSTKAALISYQNYTLDEDTNIIIGGGMEWLRWDLTKGMSINEAIAEFNGVNYGTGWRLASNQNIASLFNTFKFGANFVWDADENTTQVFFTPDDGIENLNSDAELQFLRLFGSRTPEFPDDYIPENIEKYIWALFGSDLDGDGLYNELTVQDDRQLKNSDPFGNSVLLRSDVRSSNYKVNNGLYTDLAVALVRVPINVPEPSTAAIFALGLLGLALRRFKKQA